MRSRPVPLPVTLGCQCTAEWLQSLQSPLPHPARYAGVVGAFGCYLEYNRHTALRTLADKPACAALSTPLLTAAGQWPQKTGLDSDARSLPLNPPQHATKLHLLSLRRVHPPSRRDLHPYNHLTE